MTEPAERQHVHITFAVLALGAVAYAMMQSLVTPALPDFQHALHTSENGVSWLLTALLLSASVGTPIIGRLGDMYGKERMLVIVLALLSVGVLVSALSTSLPVMIVGRTIQGIAGGIYPLAFGIIRDEFPENRVAGGIGLMSALLAVGGGLGVVLAGPILQGLDYHYLFWLPLILIVLATVLTYIFVPESPIKVPGAINWVGAILMALGLVAVLVPVSEASQWHWVSAKTLGGIALGIVLLALWVVSEVRSKQPLVDMRMMRIRGVWATNLVAVLIGFAMFGSFLLLPQFVQTPSSRGYGFGASVTQAGPFLIPGTITMLVFGSLTGKLEQRFGSKPLLIAGGLIAAASFAILAWASSSTWHVYLASAILGVGIGLAFAAMANLIIENVGPGETGVATGMNTVMRSVGGAFGGAVAASVLARTVTHGYPTAHGYTTGFAICVIVSVLAALAGLVVPQRRPEDAFEPHTVGDLGSATHSPSV